jgi:hypothetical protein
MMAKNGTVANVTRLPDCQLCGHDDPSSFRYDAMMDDGRWAFMCNRCWHTYRKYPLLGVGIGQRLELR